MRKVKSKKELLSIIGKFLADERRGISIVLFAELCGVSKDSLIDVFINKTSPLTEYIQVRVDKGYQEWVAGNVRIMKNRNNTKFIEYRKTSQPRLARSMGLHIVNGEIKLKIGIRNKADYSGKTLDEQLRGNHG